MARNPKLSNDIIEKMKSMILNNMKPGDKFPTEKELEQILGVSRSTIRESIKVLVALGFLTSSGGTKYVSSSVNNRFDNSISIMMSMDGCSISDLLQLRQLLEVDVITLVTGKLSDETIHELERINWNLQNPDNSIDDFIAFDIQFHNALAEATGNRLLVGLLNSIREIMSSKLEEISKTLPIKDNVISSQIRLLNALKSNNREKAEACMLDHVKMSRLLYDYTPQEKGEASADDPNP